MPVAGLAFGEHRARRDVESRKQGSRAVADIVVGDALDVAQSHGQDGLGAIQSLDLALFVYA